MLPIRAPRARSVKIPLRNRANRFKTYLILTPLALILVCLVGFLIVRLEGKKPKVAWDLTGAYIGSARDVSLSVADAESGVRSVRVVLAAGGREILLLEKAFSGGGLFRDGRVRSETMTFSIAPRKLGVADGEAFLRAEVRDFSWRRWWHGNQALLEKQVIVDTRPPGIDVVTRNAQHQPGRRRSGGL